MFCRGTPFRNHYRNPLHFRSGFPFSKLYFRWALKYILSISFFIIAIAGQSQTLGGNAVFNFLKQSNTPQLTALGGVNISQLSNDAGLAFNNPALLKSSMHTQLNTVFNLQYAGIKVYHTSFAFRNEKLNTNFLWGLHYFDYGNSTATDASGNILGSFRPRDWVMQVGASRSYGNRWNYGVNLKFISSAYGIYRSNGMAADVGLLYTDSAGLFSASVLVKNMGTQFKTYPSAGAEDPRQAVGRRTTGRRRPWG